MFSYFSVESPGFPWAFSCSSLFRLWEERKFGCQFLAFSEFRRLRECMFTNLKGKRTLFRYFFFQFVLFGGLKKMKSLDYRFFTFHIWIFLQLVAVFTSVMVLTVFPQHHSRFEFGYFIYVSLSQNKIFTTATAL